MALFLRIHWLTPTSIVAALLAGVVFAIGHHLFYQSLAGRFVTDDTYSIAGLRISRQQLNTAAGTTFAFLVKSLLSIAVSLSYMQLVWNEAKKRNQSILLKDMDVVFSALGNAFVLADVHVWFKRPLLFLMVLFAWLIPFASVITPAALSIGVHTPPPELRNVPQTAFKSLNLLTPLHGNPYDGIREICPEGFDEKLGDKSNVCTTTINYVYNGPSDAVRRVASATAAQGNVLTVEAPAANSSWSLEFTGPSLRCKEVVGDMKRVYESSIANLTLWDCQKAPSYLAWAPTNVSDEDIQSTLPFLGGSDGSYTFNTGLPIERENGSLSSFFIASSISSIRRIGNGTEAQSIACKVAESNDTYDDKLSVLFDDATTIIRCDAVEATYHTNFDFVNGNQQVAVRVANASESPIETISHLDALFNESLHHDKCDILSVGDGVCKFDSTLLARLSYQAVMDAFAELLLGKISVKKSGHLYSTTFDSNTSICNTILTKTTELNFLNSAPRLGVEGWPSLQDIRPTWDNSLYEGLSNSPGESLNLSLRNALEELFQNVTVSLMSSPSLQPNKSSAFYPSKTKVFFSTNRTIYVYSRQRLWSAYGTVIALSAMTVAIGLTVIYINGASFSNSFSSILRLSRGAKLSPEIEPGDLDGRDPFPKGLKRARIVFPNNFSDCDQRENVYKKILEQELNEG